MKNRIHVLILLVALPCVTMAEWSAPQVRHWAHLNGITADTSGLDVSSDDGIVGGWNIAWGAHPTLAQVEALDYATALDWTRATDEAQSTLDAELGQEMLANMVAAIQTEWPDITFNGSKKQVRALSRRLISEARQASAILNDSNKTDAERLEAAAKLRRLDVISGYANQLGIGARK